MWGHGHGIKAWNQWKIGQGCSGTLENWIGKQEERKYLWILHSIKKYLEQIKCMEVMCPLKEERKMPDDDLGWGATPEHTALVEDILSRNMAANGIKLTLGVC